MSMGLFTVCSNTGGSNAISNHLVVASRLAIKARETHMPK